jgi:hypothetical protein
MSPQIVFQRLPTSFLAIALLEAGIGLLTRILLPQKRDPIPYFRNALTASQCAHG